MSLPETTQEPILYIDATPNDDYPLRILKAYRTNCNAKWMQQAGEPNPLLNIMNNLQDRRAEILDRAIALLEGESIMAGDVIEPDNFDYFPEFDTFGD